MANVIIKREETKQHEAYVLRSFGVHGKGTCKGRQKEVEERWLQRKSR